MGEIWFKICSLAHSLVRPVLFCGGDCFLDASDRGGVRPSVRWKMETRVRARLRERACLSVCLSADRRRRRWPRDRVALSLSVLLPAIIFWINSIINDYTFFLNLQVLLNMKSFTTFVVAIVQEGSHVDGRAGERESFQRAARTGGGGRARRHRRPGGRPGGGRAIQRTTFASHGPLEGSTEGRKNEAKPLQLPLFHPLARSLASNTTVDLGCKACRQCFHFR